VELADVGELDELPNAAQLPPGVDRATGAYLLWVLEADVDVSDSGAIGPGPILLRRKVRLSNCSHDPDYETHSGFVVLIVASHRPGKTVFAQVAA
jgi:hypothetical protein